MNPSGRLRARVTTLREANLFVQQHHRHHKPARGARAVLGVQNELSQLVGVALVGRPVSRMLQREDVLEVTRLATDGTPGACSFLLARARSVAGAMGASKLVTYTLPQEGGASLRGAGFACAGEAGGGSWSRAARRRGDHAPLQTKLRWEAGPCYADPSRKERAR